MVRVVLGLGVSVAILCSPASGLAQVYTCTDKNGRYIIADRIVKECAESPVRELDRRGMTVREIDAPMTDAQRRAQETAERKRQQDHANEEERQRQDQALMGRYKREADIAAARKKDMDQIDRRIAQSDLLTSQAANQLQSAQTEANTASHSGTVPDALQARIRDAQFLLDEQKKLGAANRQEKKQINTRYAHILQRFRDLQASTQLAQPVAGK